MKIEKIYEFYKDSCKIISCPICNNPIYFEKPASIRCQNKHCFDLSNKGYLNFLTNQKQTMYQKELFESRRILFETGYYEPLANKLVELIETRSVEKESIYLADIGCGEGYYSGYIKQKIKKAEIYAIDNCKDAILMGAKKYTDIKWMVGNLANLPLQSNSIDILLEIFSPSNYKEFTRVLKHNGCLIKVIPGNHYLQELRECINFQTTKTPYTSQRVKEYFSEKMHFKDSCILTYTKKISKEEKEHFIAMSPMLFGKSKTKIDLDQIQQFTFHFEILIGEIAVIS